MNAILKVLRSGLYLEDKLTKEPILELSVNKRLSTLSKKSRHAIIAEHIRLCHHHGYHILLINKIK